MMGISIHQMLMHLMFLGGPLVASLKTGDWSGCSATCQVGAEQVYRYQISHCDNPNSGDCNGMKTESFPCNLPKCPVDGAWSSWGQWSSCSQSCGSGVRRQSRDCNNPVPSAGGRYCEGHHEKLEHCSPQPCPVPTSWTAWTYWTKCEDCTRGAQSIRRRFCTPRSVCVIPHKDDKKNCAYDENRCPVDGTWSPWGPWSDCSVTCTKDNGTMTQKRSCMEPQRGGKDCEGESHIHKICSGSVQCPVNCQWEQWGPWKTVGDDILRKRIRNGPYNGGKDCPGDSTELRSIQVNGSGSGSGDGDGSKGDEENSSGLDTRSDEDNASGNEVPMPDGDDNRDARSTRIDEEGNSSGNGS